MSLLEQLNSDMKLFMKNREKDKLIVIRMVKASLQNEAIKVHSLAKWTGTKMVQPLLKRNA